MSVKATSIRAYYDELPKIGARQRQVLDALASRDMTNREISRATGLEINTVTPRTLEMRKLGLVTEKGTIVDPVTRKRVTLWGLVSKDMQQVELF